MLPNHVINTDTVVKNADTLNLQRGNAEVKNYCLATIYAEGT